MVLNTGEIGYLEGAFVSIQSSLSWFLFCIAETAKKGDMKRMGE